MTNRFVKDNERNGVINTDVDSIKAAKVRKALKLKEKERQQQLEQEVSELKSDIGEIKSLLKQVLNGNNAN